MGTVEWCLQMLRKFDGGRPERVWDIATGRPENQAAVFTLAFPRREPTCEIQEIEKHFQTDGCGLLRQTESCGLCSAPAEEDSQRRVVH